MQWILYMIISFKKGEVHAIPKNDRQMQNCKIAKLQIVKLQVASFVDSLNVTEKRRKRRETTGDRRDMLVHC